ncbi:DegT/DnrJ/EryC1/StrS aminotransferase family protein [Metapseudomonas lalkuanensis]|uniref:DegT/DnrJ/EryC1/StrS family aminotransferase n=1 Tax=Metapseudomonas lalkuanensis TaxID=2604832 RepID=UPI001CF2965A|nr:DegT/DnrJ/EryC1/StrS aminotransferase family protein [Pseudomonas lalkuanensis]UCO99849.1 DegT/DnrJ/EryC1/StrS aminotransferase family protein [Pseudomonas lalkuanensis]
MSRIHYTKPSIGELELEYVTDAVRNGWGERCYDYIHRFQNDFARYLGVSHAVATSSCTGALHLGLRALDIGAGDEVILADINWIASAAPVFYVGAVPVLVDVLEDSWCLDPEQVRRAITPRTRAIIAVHLYGNLAAMRELKEIADQHGIALIEDAAEALGSAIDGHKAGSLSSFSVFSFHGTKVMTTGEGGMLASRDAELVRRVEQLNNHGRAAGDMRQFWPSELGHKYKMSNLQAALGCAQLERIDELVCRKREIFAYYAERLLPALPGCRMNPEPEGCLNSYWMPTLVLPTEFAGRRAEVLESLRLAGIDARIFFQPLGDTPVFAGIARRPTPVSHDLAQRAFNLPSYHDMSRMDQDRVVSAILAGIDGRATGMMGAAP